jgi:hypothetical protein
MSLSICKKKIEKRFWGYIRKKKKREENVRREREKRKCHTRREGPTPVNNKFRDE